MARQRAGSHRVPGEHPGTYILTVAPAVDVARGKAVERVQMRPAELHKTAQQRAPAADKKAKEEKAAQEAADKAARSEARRQITLILRNGGTVPNDLWEQSGYSAVTIAAMLRGRKG